MVLPFCERWLVDRLLALEPQWLGLINEGPRFLSLCTEEDAEVAVPSHAWQFIHGNNAQLEGAVHGLARRMQEQGKRTLVFCHSDEDLPVRLPGAIVFRQSCYASRRGSDEFAQPSFCADVLAERDGRLMLREKRPRPSIGFCGFVPHLTRPVLRLRSGLRHSLHGLGFGRDAMRSPRARAILGLRREPLLDTDFIVRSGSPWSLGHQTPSSWRTEFAENLMGNDYALCVRGFGNYSYRLFEALSAGRIPVFVNTDCVLPCDHEVNWRELFVWIEASELDRVGERVLEFHERLTDAEFCQRQQRCRELWERYLSPHGFHRWLATQLVPSMLR